MHSRSEINVYEMTYWLRDGKDSSHDSRGHWGQGNAGLSVPVKLEAREEPKQRQDDNLYKYQFD